LKKAVEVANPNKGTTVSPFSSLKWPGSIGRKRPSGGGGGGGGGIETLRQKGLFRVPNGSGREGTNGPGFFDAARAACDPGRFPNRGDPSKAFALGK